MSFLSDAIIRDLPRAELILRGLPIIWHGEFQSDLICGSDIAGDFNIPRGFITDGASVPRMLWNMLSDTDPDILYPAYAHDLLYTLRGKLPKVQLSRKQADAVIREQMLDIDAPRWKADTVYNVLRIHGGSAWAAPRAVKVRSIKRSLI